MEGDVLLFTAPAVALPPLLRLRASHLCCTAFFLTFPVSFCACRNCHISPYRAISIFTIFCMRIISWRADKLGYQAREEKSITYSGYSAYLLLSRRNIMKETKRTVAAKTYISKRASQ